MKYLKADSSERGVSRSRPARMYVAIEKVSMARNIITRSEALPTNMKPRVANRTSA